MSEKKYLGVEFYRNFVGIEKPLKVLEYDNRVEDFEDIDLIEDSWCINHCDFSNVKPYLRTIKDLSDEEIKDILNNSCKYFSDSVVDRIKKTDNAIEIDITRYYDNIDISPATHNILFSCYDNIALDDDCYNIDVEKFLSGLRELHCDPRAKEYIDNGLALRVEK